MTTDIDRAVDAVRDADNDWRAHHDDAMRYAVLTAARAYLDAVLALAVAVGTITERWAARLRDVA